MHNSLLSEIVAPAKKQISVVWDYFGIQKGKEDSIYLLILSSFSYRQKWQHFKLTSAPQD